MTELQKELEQVWKLLGAIPVKGDSVEVMAAAREGLRRAYQMSGKDGEDDGGQ